MDDNDLKNKTEANDSKNLCMKETKEEGGEAGPRAEGLWLFFLVMVVLIVGALFAGFFLGQLNELKINFSYVALALIGVFFHLANQYRVRRDEEGFIWAEYKYDYYFRALQAIVYVIVISYLVSRGKSELSGEMTMISLLIGMYIRKVEEAFETLGDRFGDTIRGILGSTVQRLTPAERRQKLAELEQRWTALNKNYLSLKSKVEEPERGAVEGLISKAKELILKGKVEAAELKLLDLDFKIKNL